MFSPGCATWEELLSPVDSRWVSTIPSVEWDDFFYSFSENLSYREREGQRTAGDSKIAEPDQLSGYSQLWRLDLSQHSQ